MFPRILKRGDIKPTKEKQKIEIFAAIYVKPDVVYFILPMPFFQATISDCLRLFDYGCRVTKGDL